MCSPRDQEFSPLQPDHLGPDPPCLLQHPLHLTLLNILLHERNHAVPIDSQQSVGDVLELGEGEGVDQLPVKHTAARGNSLSDKGREGRDQWVAECEGEVGEGVDKLTVGMT